METVGGVGAVRDVLGVAPVTVAVLSVRGGVGKSTLAVALGRVLASGVDGFPPLRVVVVDADVRDSNLCLNIGRSTPTIETYPNGDSSGNTVSSCLIHDDSLGVDVLLAPAGGVHATTEIGEVYRRAIRELQTSHDVIIVDCAVQFRNPVTAAVVPLADRLLYVSPPNSSSLVDASTIVNGLPLGTDGPEWDVPRGAVDIVINESFGSLRRAEDMSDAISEAFVGFPVLGVLPHVPSFPNMRELYADEGYMRACRSVANAWVATAIGGGDVSC